MDYMENIPSYVEILESKPKKSYENDEQFEKRRKRNISLRETTYTEIISTYSDYLKNSLGDKECFKKCILIACALIFIAVIVLLFICVIHVKEATSIISACIAFVGAVIDIPIIVSKYVFNAEEEKYMIEIIKNIQDYDSHK